MWHALKAELAYFRIWLVGGIGIAIGITLFMHGIKWYLNDTESVPGFVTNMFLLIAGMVVAFVAQGYRSEEHRNYLLMAGPLTPRQLAGVLVLLPACLMGLGLLFTAIKMGLEAMLTGRFNPEDVRMTGSFAGQFWAAAQLGPLAQEATAARREQRNRASAIGWAAFVGTILLLAVSWLFSGATFGLIGPMLAVVVAMVAAFTLYEGRTDFTR
jgi:hypothetical protein